MIDFEPTDTQKQIVKTAAEFGREVLGPAERELDNIGDPNAVFSSPLYRKTLAQAYELGFHKMAIAEEYGGLGLDQQTTGMVWEELGRWGVGFSAGMISGAIAPQLIIFLAKENKALIDRFVIPYCDDTKAKHISGWCSSEPELGSDGKSYNDPKIRHQTKATKKGGSWIIDGRKSDFISNGGIATMYIVFANVDPKMGLKGSGTFVVPGDAKGLGRGRFLDKIGLRTLNQAAVYLDNVEIPENHMILPPGEMYPLLHNSIITVGNLSVGYLAVGIMRAAYEDALDHAKQRIQGGKPIIEHQLIAEKFVKMHIAIETARAYLWKGSRYSTLKFPGDLRTSLSAKVYATEQAAIHTAEMVQVFGGYGISKEYSVEKYARDAHLLKIMDGTNDTLMTRIAPLL